MKKIYMIVDAFSALTKKQAEERGYGYIPQILIIEGKAYKDGVDIFMKDSVELIKNTKDFKTSVPPVGEIMDIIEKSSKENDIVIYWPMNKGVTSTYGTVVTVAREYDNVYVADIKMYSDVLKNTIIKVQEMLESGESIEKTFDYIKDINAKTTQYIIPKTIDALIKGGRLSGAKKVIMEKGKLIPRIKFTDDGLKTVGLKRSFSKMVKKTVEHMAQDLPNPDDYEWQVIHTGDMETKKIATDAIEELGFTYTEEWIPPVVSIHIGVGGVGISTFPKIK